MRSPWEWLHDMAGWSRVYKAAGRPCALRRLPRAPRLAGQSLLLQASLRKCSIHAWQIKDAEYGWLRKSCWFNVVLLRRPWLLGPRFGFGHHSSLIQQRSGPPPDQQRKTQEAPRICPGAPAVSLVSLLRLVECKMAQSLVIPFSRRPTLRWRACTRHLARPLASQARPPWIDCAQAGRAL